jgi:DNA-binding NarL/FixJ family response regulator
LRLDTRPRASALGTARFDHRTERSVLIVDDDEHSRRRLVAGLEQMCLHTFVADSGLAGLEVARAQLPALVAVEVCLPDLSGYELCHQLRLEAGNAPSIILMSSRRVERLDRVAGLLIGADDYLTKPVDLDEFLLRVRSLLGRSEPTDSGLERLLTPRELEILCSLAEGLEQREVALALTISPKTVATHIERILRKLGARSRAQAIAMAYQTGLMNDRMPVVDHGPVRSAVGRRA